MIYKKEAKLYRICKKESFCWILAFGRLSKTFRTINKGPKIKKLTAKNCSSNLTKLLFLLIKRKTALVKPENLINCCKTLSRFMLMKAIKS